MALEDKMKKEAPKAPSLSDAEELDLDIAILMGERLLEEGGFDVIEQALATSSDPAQPIGQFFVQLIQKLQESFPEEMKLSPNIYLSRGGWVEHMMDFVGDELDVDKKILDRAEIYVAQAAMELAKQQSPEGAGPAPQAQAQPPLPQGGSY